MTVPPAPVVLDTDIGNDPDDLLALAMVLDRPELDLRGVVTTRREPGLRAGFVRHLCAVAGRSVPVGVGSAAPDSDPPDDFHRDYFEKDGADLSASGFCSAAEVLEQVDAATTLITIGALTSLAAYLAERPGRAAGLGPLVSMGGFVSRRKSNFVREYNFGSDPAASRVVLAAGLSQLCVTKNVCTRALMRPADLERLEVAGNPARAWAFAFMRAWFREREEKRLHDPLTVAAAIDPEGLPFRPVTLEVDDEGAVKATLVADSPVRAAVGGDARMDWFEPLFYG